jgi:hypothetical protein
MNRPMNKYDAYRAIMDAIADWDTKDMTTQELHTKVIEVVNQLEQYGLKMIEYRDFQGDMLAIRHDLYS